MTSWRSSEWKPVPRPIDSWTEIKEFLFMAFQCFLQTFPRGMSSSMYLLTLCTINLKLRCALSSNVISKSSSHALTMVDNPFSTNTFTVDSTFWRSSPRLWYHSFWLDDSCVLNDAHHWLRMSLHRTNVHCHGSTSLHLQTSVHYW